MLDTIKNFIIGKSREEELSPYADALNTASAARNTAAKQQEYAKNWLAQNPNYGDQSFTSAMQQIASDDYLKQYEDQLSEYQNIWDKAKKQQEWNVAGSGLLGSMLNSALQSGSALTDLQRSGLKEWQEGRRDALSDIGAGIDTGLTIASFIPGVGLAKGATTAAKAAPTLGKTILKGAGRGALYGGIGSLGNYLQTTGNEATLGNAALSSAIGAGTGGLLGGGLSGLGYGIGKLRSNSVVGNQKVGEAAKKATEANAAVSSYQDALQTAKNVGLDTSSEEALKKSYNAFMKANHPDKVAAQAQQNQIIALLPEHASQSTISPYTDAVTKGTGTGYVSTYDIMTPEAKAINAQAVENAQKLASETVKPVSEAYNTLSGASLADLLGESKAANQTLKKASNQALIDYLKGTKLGKIGSSKLGKAAAIGGTAYGISRLLGNRNGGNNE